MFYNGAKHLNFELISMTSKRYMRSLTLIRGIKINFDVSTQNPPPYNIDLRNYIWGLHKLSFLSPCFYLPYLS